MAADNLQNTLTLTFLILKENLILVIKSNICMAGKTTYKQKLSLTEVKELSLELEKYFNTLILI